MGNTVLDGHEISVKLLVQNLTINFLEIKLNDGVSRFIAFQDVLNADSTPSFEAVKTMEMVDRTIKHLK